MRLNSVFELRRYRLRHDARDTLIDLFEREFVHTQEEVGIWVEGQYRDLDDPDAFVWVRSFPAMEDRARALAAFYGGPVWRVHGDAANATMVNSDNVLLLRPAPDAAKPFDRDATVAETARGIVTISCASLAPGRAEAFAAFFVAEAAPLITAAGARIDAAFTTLAAANTFPRLPVREGETAFVWVAAFRDEEGRRQHDERLAADPHWRDVVFPALDRWLWRPLETARLSPTEGSRHRW